MNAKNRKVFETDRRMELRLRLAAKKARVASEPVMIPQYATRIPERELVTRIIERVRTL
ncbi:MAG: hypothetical protein V3V44_00090 [Anaerolineales bacterium]